MPPENALLIIDVQRDFCTGGALEVPSGEQVIPPLNRMIEHVAARGETIYATRDWHPPMTRHFKDFGGAWPVHCVAGSPGAEFHPALALPETATIVTTGDTDDSGATRRSMAGRQVAPRSPRT